MKRISIFIFLVAAMTVSHLFGGIKGKLGLGLNINANKLYGDTRSGGLGLGGGNLLLRYRLKPALFLESELGFLRLSTQINGTSLDTDMLNFGVKAGYTFLTSQIYQPFIYVGLGALNFSDNSGRFWDGYAALGAGTEFFASTSLAVNVTADFRYTSGDGFDGGFDGSRKDGYLNLGLGFIYHFNRYSNQNEPFIREDLPKVNPSYYKVTETKTEEETGGIKGKLGLGLNINANKLYGDTRIGGLGPGGGSLLLRYRLKPGRFLESEFGLLRLSTQINGTSLDTDILNFGVKAGYTFFTSQRYQPSIYFGFGALNYSDDSGRFWDGYAVLGAGTEFFVSDFLAVNITADFRYTSGDGFDGGLSGFRTDGFLNLGLGFIYHFNRYSNQNEPFFLEDLPKVDPFYFEVTETKTEEEIEGIVESTDQELIMQTFQSLMEEEQAPKDDIPPGPDRTWETVVYTVQPNDWLSKIAEIFYGDPMAYPKIAQDNPLVINNPDKIEPGQKLLITIPRGTHIFYTVKKGDWLYKIARKIFGDQRKFKDIFLANQDTIEDPDIIHPGQVLKIFLTKN